MSVRAPDTETITAAARALDQGELVAFATETVYGLGADACNSNAVAKIFQAKQRPRFNPLIVHVPDLQSAAQLAVLKEPARALAKQFWPGAFTVVAPLRPEAGLSELVTAGLETVALRVPNHADAQSLLRAVGRPIAAPSANRSGAVSPTRAHHVAEDLGDAVALILDSGPTQLGLESTIVHVTDDDIVLLRAGAIARTDIESAVGRSVSSALSSPGSSPQAPGQLASHYAPNAKLRLNATNISPDEALLAFGPHPHHSVQHAINLSATADLTEAAKSLFASLRELDKTGAATIAVMPIPNSGLGEAINDRLQRAAAPRGDTFAVKT